MDKSDRTAIHEVMEQQTISISKAGITTMLKVCMSIQAMANPLYDCYNLKVSLVETTDLPAALIILFQLALFLLDKPSCDDDNKQLAQHVTYVHMCSKHPDLKHKPLDLALVQ